MSANWDESSSQMSRQIGPLKPLNAGGGRNTALGECVYVPSVCVCVHVSFPVEIHPGHSSKGVIRCVFVCVRSSGCGWGINPSGDRDSYGFTDLDAMKWFCGSFRV